MRFVLQLGFASFRNYTALAQAAEEAGFSQLAMPDSLFYPRATESDYPYAETEHIRGYIEQTDFIEPFIAMATMAAVTRRVGFYPAVLKLPVRQPLLVAKLLTSLAVVSDGRVSLGVGLSPWKEDFTYNGVDFDKRGAIMDECIEIVRGATTGEYFEYHGKHFDFGPLRIRPVPARPVPILVGGHSKPALRRAARLGDGWASANTDYETLKKLIGELNAQRAEYGTLGRADYEIHGIDFSARTRDDFRRMRDLGYTHAGLFPWESTVEPADQAAQVDAIRRFGDEVIAQMD